MAFKGIHLKKRYMFLLAWGYLSGHELSKARGKVRVEMSRVTRAGKSRRLRNAGFTASDTNLRLVIGRCPHIPYS